jgi:hypothetical protein
MKKCGRYGCRNIIEGVESPYIMQNLCEDCQIEAKAFLGLLDSGNLDDLEKIKNSLIPSQERIDFEQSRKCALCNKHRHELYYVRKNDSLIEVCTECRNNAEE